MKKNKDTRGIIPVFIPHRGCGHECVFCNQRKISGREETVGWGEMATYVEDCLATMSQSIKEIAFFGGSFTGLPVAEQLHYLQMASQLKKNNQIQEIRLSTRPDYINEEILQRLEVYGVDSIELGCQSFDPKVLAISQRGHTQDEIFFACQMIKSRGFKLGIQLMCGLPGDSDEGFKESVRQAIKMAPDMVRLYPTIVIKDTLLEKMYRSGTYSPLALEDAVSACAYALMAFDEMEIQVIRIGLQSSEGMAQGENIITGPYHPAFGELVKSEVFYRKISEKVDFKNEGSIIISVAPQDISCLIGQKKNNLNRWMKKSKSIKILQCKSLSKGEIKITKQENEKQQEEVIHVFKKN